MNNHQGQKILNHSFNAIWEKLCISGTQSLQTENKHDCEAFARITTRGVRKGDKVIRITKDGREFARIYECCWRCTINCFGTRIGGYSEALDKWGR